MNRINIIFLTLLLLVGFLSIAQEDTDIDNNPLKESKGLSIRAFYQGGIVIPTNNYVKGVNYNNTPVDRYQSMSVQFGWQTNGRKTWQQIYGYPYIIAP